MIWYLRNGFPRPLYCNILHEAEVLYHPHINSVMKLSQQKKQLRQSLGVFGYEIGILLEGIFMRAHL